MTDRYICSVFEEMRMCLKTQNFSYLLGLIEEAQSAANRMESKLYDQADFATRLADHTKLKEEIKRLQAKKKELEELAKPKETSDAPV